MKEARRVCEVEGFVFERRRKDIPHYEVYRRCKVGLREPSSGVLDSVFIYVEDGEASGTTDALAEAFDPEQRRATGVEHVESPDVAQQI